MNGGCNDTADIGHVKLEHHGGMIRSLRDGWSRGETWPFGFPFKASQRGPQKRALGLGGAPQTDPLVVLLVFV